MTICTCKKCLLDRIHGLLKKERAKCAKAFDHLSSQSGGFCDTLITHNEPLVHHYDLETNAQSKQWKRYDSPPPKRTCVQPSKSKRLLTDFLNQRRVVMVDFLAYGTRLLE